MNSANKENHNGLNNACCLGLPSPDACVASSTFPHLTTRLNWYDKDAISLEIDGENFVFFCQYPSWNDGCVHSWRNAEYPFRYGSLVAQDEHYAFVQIGSQISAYRRMVLSDFAVFKQYEPSDLSEFQIHALCSGTVYNFAVESDDIEPGTSYFLDVVTQARHTLFDITFSHRRTAVRMKPLLRRNTHFNRLELSKFTERNRCFITRKLHPYTDRSVNWLVMIGLPLSYDLVNYVCLFLEPLSWFRAFVVGDWFLWMKFSGREVSGVHVSRSPIQSRSFRYHMSDIRQDDLRTVNALFAEGPRVERLKCRIRTRQEIDTELARGNVEKNPGPVKKPPPKAPRRNGKQAMRDSINDGNAKKAQNLCANKRCRKVIPDGSDVCQACRDSRCACGGFTNGRNSTCGICFRKSMTLCQECCNWHPNQSPCGTCESHRAKVQSLYIKAKRTEEIEQLKNAGLSALRKRLPKTGISLPVESSSSESESSQERPPPRSKRTNAPPPPASDTSSTAPPSTANRDFLFPDLDFETGRMNMSDTDVDAQQDEERPVPEPPLPDAPHPPPSNNADDVGTDTGDGRNVTPNHVLEEKPYVQPDEGYCTFDGCDQLPVARNLCQEHYDCHFPPATPPNFGVIATQTRKPEPAVILYDQVHFNERCTDVLRYFGLPRDVTCADIAKFAIAHNLTLVVRENDTVIYSASKAANGIMLEYNSHSQTAHVSILHFRLEQVDVDGQPHTLRLGSPTSDTVARVARFHRGMAFATTRHAAVLTATSPVVHFSLIAYLSKIALTRTKIGWYCAKKAFLMWFNDPDPTPLAPPQFLEELSVIDSATELNMLVSSFSGILDSLKHRLSALAKPIHSVRDLIDLGLATASEYINPAPPPPTWRLFSITLDPRFPRKTKCLMVVGLCAMTTLAFLIGIFRSDTVRDLVRRYIFTRPTIDLPIERPAIGSVVTLLPGMRSVSTLHSANCTLFAPSSFAMRLRTQFGLPRHTLCDCAAGATVPVELNKFFMGRVNGADPEVVRASQIAYTRQTAIAGVTPPPGHDVLFASAARSRAFHDAQLDAGTHVVPHRDWFDLVPRGCLVCGKEGVRCSHNPQVCHCGFKNIVLKGETFCGLCDHRRRPKRCETRSTKPEDARLIRAFHRGQAVAVHDRILPHAAYATPCYTCVKTVDVEPRDTGPMITTVRSSDIVKERFGAQFNGMSFAGNLPYNAQPDVAGITTSISNRQAYCKHRKGTTGSKFNPHYIKLYKNAMEEHHEDITQGLTSHPVYPIPRAHWLMRFPPSRRAQIQRDMDHYDRCGLQDSDMTRVCFVKNELICKGTHDAVRDGEINVQKLLNTYNNLIDVFDPEGFFTPQFVSYTTAKQRALHSRLDRSCRWYYNTAARTTISANAVQNTAIAYYNQKIRWAAPRNITSYKTYKPSGITGPAFVAWLDRAKKHFSRNRLFHITCGLNNVGIGRWFDECIRDGFTNFGDGDAVKFDASVDDVHYDVIHGLYKHLDPGLGKDFWRVLKNMRRHKAESGSRNGDHVKWEQRGDASRGSGDNDTTLGNTLLAISLHYFALANWWAQKHHLDQLPSPAILEQYFRVAVIGDDVVVASRLSKDTFTIDMLTDHYAGVGFEYELVDRSGIYSVSFMGSSPFPARMNGRHVTVMVPEMPRWLPKIGVTANANIDPLTWCRSVGLGWAATAECHPIMRPIIAKYLNLTPDCSVKPFQYEEYKASKVSQQQLMEDPLAHHAIHEKYGIGTHHIKHIQRLIGQVETLPCVILSPAFDALL